MKANQNKINSNISATEDFINRVGTRGAMHLLNKKGEAERDTRSVWIAVWIAIAFALFCSSSLWVLRTIVFVS